MVFVKFRSLADMGSWDQQGKSSTNRKFSQSPYLRAPYSCLEPEGIVEFHDDIRARGTKVIFVAIEEVVIKHQIEILSGFREKV